MLTFVDGRQTLPRHATKTFSLRDVAELAGGTAHQTAGGDDPVSTAIYHISEDNHVAEGGCPGLLYTFFIRQIGEVWWCHDLDRRVWSQGGHGSPVPGTSANGSFVSICLGGSYDGEGYDGRDGLGPTFAQLHALLALWGHLCGVEQHPAIPAELFGVLSCPVEALYGHHNFGKPACPGTVTALLTDSVRSHLPPPVELPGTIATTRDWQTALKALGHYAGAIDGQWGPKSRGALVKFQRTRSNLTVDGTRGPMSKAALEAAVRDLEA